MTILQTPCHEPVLSKLDEISGAITKLPEFNRNPHTDIIVVSVVAFAICVIALTFIIMYLSKKYPKKNDDHKKNEDGEGNKKALLDYQSKHLDFIKEETVSYTKIYRELDCKSKRMAAYKELQTAFDELCSKLSPDVAADLFKEMLAFQKSFDNLIAVDNRRSITKDDLEDLGIAMDKFNNKFKDNGNNPYISAIRGYEEKAAGETKSKSGESGSGGKNEEKQP